MSKLWIIHRQAHRSEAMARVIGLEPYVVSDATEASPRADAVLAGSLTDEIFETASPPAAILIALDGDLELELDFLHRHRDTLATAQRRLIIHPDDREEILRLTDAREDELLDGHPDARALRAFILSAFAHRNAESLTERRDRERIAKRFSSWFGNSEISGLLRALDPTLASLPLLVRGVPGSGRTLVARYVELFRVHGGASPTLRLDARELRDAESIATRLTERASDNRRPARTVWIDQIDALSAASQRSIAEWIRIGTAPFDGSGSGGSGSDGPLRWVATAGPGGLRDRLEPALAAVLAPLDLEIPSLADHPEALPTFVDQALADWTAQIGGVPRQVSPAAIEALEAHAWTGDRGAVESRLRAALAASSREVLEVGDLTDRFPALQGLAPQEEAPHEESTGPNAHPGAAATDALLQGFADAPVIPQNAPNARSAHNTHNAHNAHNAVSGLYDLSSDDEADLDAGEFVAPEAAEFTDPDTTDTTDDFERAFLEGLPQVANRDARPHEADAPSASADVSTQMSAESFETASTPTAAVPAVESADAVGNQNWRRLARSLSHEIRNPLVSIRTFTELLPENFEDASFRERFTELVGRDVAHIDEVVGRLATAAAQEKIESAAVDVSSVLERLLDDRRDAIGQRRLLVLRELERKAPIAWADAPSLEVALSGLLDRALAALPERGDLFVATRRIDRGADGQPRLRVLLRHHNPEQSPALGGGDRSALSDVSAAENVLEYVLAETIIEASGGQLTIDTTDPHETLILVDLRTPA